MVLIVTHGGVLHAVHQHARGYHARDKMHNGAINLMHVDSGSWALEIWNDVSHMQHLGLNTVAGGGGASGL
jgi:broad specificity phosphatase PhoE